MAVAQSLLGSVLNADQAAVRDYLAAKADVDAEMVLKAERLVQARLELDAARTALVEARRASVAAQFNLAVFAADSATALRGFVFPVGDPSTVGDSFGATRPMAPGSQHALGGGRERGGQGLLHCV